MKKIFFMIFGLIGLSADLGASSQPATYGLFPDIGKEVHIPFPNKEYIVPKKAIDLGPAYYKPRPVFGTYLNGHWLLPYVQQVKSAPYVIQGEPKPERIVEPRLGQDWEDMMVVMKRRNSLIQKKGFDINMLSEKEQEELNKILSVYPIVEV